MEYGQAKKIVEKLKLKLTDKEKHAIELIQKELNDAQEGWTTLYMKGAFDKNQDWRNKIKSKLKELKTQCIVYGGRSFGKTLAYGKQLGKIEALEDLLKEE